MLKTVEIPTLHGKVCYLDGSGKTPTVECYSHNIAFRFNAADLFPVKIGEWLSFRGKIRVDNRINDDELHEKCPQYHPESIYLHEPGDGSPKNQWLFFHLDAKYKRIGPLDAIDALRECSNSCRRFIDSWEVNDNVAELRRLDQALLYALDTIRPILRQRIIDEKEKEAPVKALDIGSI